MSILKILTEPELGLRRRSKELDKQAWQDDNFQTLAADMAETMLVKDGVGLAAPQVGANLRLIVVNTKDGVLPMVNPVLTAKSLAKEWDEEGCLSVPNTFGQVKRHKKIRCQFLTIEGNAKRIEAKGLLARVIQHEIDHLDGILFIDKAKDIHEAHEL
jgi:peptide deformylase